MADIKLIVTFPWWVIAYLKVLTWFCITFGKEPDYEKLKDFLRKHVKVKHGKH